jgi:hypothetical protein
MKYFRLLDDVHFLSRWHLSKLIGFDGMDFVRPPMIPMDSPLRDRVYDVELQSEGEEMDYTTTSFRGVPVVSFDALQAMSGLDGFTAFPARIRGFLQKQSYHVIHFWDEVDCVDEGLSEFEKFTDNDPIRPDLAGRYSFFLKLIVDSDRAKGKHIFRLANSGIEIIVSEEFKRRFEFAGIRGAVFESVSPDNGMAV